MKPWQRRLLGNLGRAFVAGAVPALMLVQTSDAGLQPALTSGALFALLWLSGAYEIDIRQTMAQRPRNRIQ